MKRFVEICQRFFGFFVSVISWFSQSNPWCAQLTSFLAFRKLFNFFQKCVRRKIVRWIHLKQLSLFSAGLSHCVSLKKFHLFYSKSGICFKLKERLSGLSGMNELKPKVCLQYFTRKHYIGEDIREGASFRKKLNF